MINKHVISVVALTALFVPVLSGAQDVSTGTWVEKQNEVKEGVVHTPRELNSGLPTGKRISNTGAPIGEVERTGKKAERAEERSLRIKDRASRLVKAAEERIGRMTENQHKIEAHIARFKSRGVDVSNAEAEIQKANISLKEATSALAELKSRLTTTVFDGSVKDAAKTIRAEFDSLHGKLKISHEAALNSIRNLKAKSASLESGKQTTGAAGVPSVRVQ